MQSSRSAARPEYIFIIDSEETIQEFKKVLAGWTNKKGLPVLSAKESTSHQSMLYRMKDSSRVAPFQVKLGPSGIRKEGQSSGASPDKNVLYIKKINLNKSRSLLTNFLQRETQEQSPYLPDANLNLKNHASELPTQSPDVQNKEDNPTIEPLDFSKIMEEAKMKLGIGNWQRTESARRRERDSVTKEEVSVLDLKPKAEKNHIIDSDDSSGDIEDNSSLQAVKQTRTSHPSTRILIVPQSQTQIKPSMYSRDNDGNSRRLTLRVKPFRPELTQAGSPKWIQTPQSLNYLSSPKNTGLDQLKQRLLSFQNTSSNKNSITNLNQVERSPPLLERQTAPTNGQSPIKKPLASRNLSRRLFTSKGTTERLSVNNSP